MIEARLLDEVKYGTLFGRSYATQRVPLRSGVVRRNAGRSQSVRRYNLNYKNLTPAQHAAVVAAFEVCDGSNESFRIKDWADYSATNEPLGTTPGANSNPVQFYKTYTFGSSTKQRKLTKMVSGTVTVYQDTGSGPVAKTGTVNLNTGTFTPTTAWTAGATLTWTGEFDVPVCFSSDDLDFVYDDYLRLTANVQLEEDLAETISPTA